MPHLKYKKLDIYISYIELYSTLSSILNDVFYLLSFTPHY